MRSELTNRENVGPHRYWRELHRTFNFLSSHPDVRCIVLSSSFEKVFTAGLDCKSFYSLSLVCDAMMAVSNGCRQK